MLLNIETGEGRLVGWMFLHSFLLGFANNFVQTAAFALFMVTFNAQLLAWVYIANAVVVPLLSMLYLRLGKRLSFTRLLSANLGFLLVMILAFRLGLGLPEANWPVFILPMLFQILVNFGNLEFWSLAGRLFDMRQGKRLFGVIGAGQWLAIVLTGSMIPFLVSQVGTTNLLFLAAAGIAGAWILLAYLSRVYSDQLTIPTSDSTTQAERPKAVKEKRAPKSASLFRSRYVVLILALVVAWWMSFFLIDNLFYDLSAAQYPSAEQLASFLGIFLASLGVITLFCNTLLSGWVINRFGLRTSLLVLPALLLAGTTAMLIGGIAGEVIALLFWLVVLTKLLDMSLGFSVDRAALSILYQPVPAAQRSQAVTLAEGIFQPFANGLAGVLLLSFSAFGTSGSASASSRLPLLAGLVVVVAIWLGSAWLLGKEYPSMLKRALTRRRLEGEALLIVDKSSLEVLKNGLKDPNPGVAIYCMNMLASVDAQSLPQVLLDLLAHPAPEARQEALRRMQTCAAAMSPAALPAIQHLVETDPSIQVRAAALRVLPALGEVQITPERQAGGQSTFDQVAVFLEHPDLHIRQGAMLGLLHSGGISGVLTAGQSLLKMAESPHAHERQMAAQTLGEIGVESFYQPLLPLLNDEDVHVQRAALLAAGQLRSPRLWPVVLEKLTYPRVRQAVTAALVMGGQAVLPELFAAFEHERQPELASYSPTMEVRALLARICGRIGGEQAVGWLKGHMTHPDEKVRHQVVQALERGSYRPQANETGQVQIAIRDEAQRSTEVLAILVDLDERDSLLLLKKALHEALNNHVQCIFSLLSFLYDREAILGARQALQQTGSSKRAYALEALDVSVGAELRNMFFPLLSDAPYAQRLAQMQKIFPEAARQAADDESPDRRSKTQLRLQEIINAPEGRYSQWTRACALYALGVINATASTKEASMLSTIEKVIVLKKASIFAETPDETLAEVAPFLEEVAVSAGESVFHKGDLGDCMYLIVDGEVRVHDGERSLNHLKSGDVFGESAVLDAEPRMATVTAVVDTQLLRLRQEQLYDVMEMRSEVSRGIIRVLSRHLRARLEDLRELRDSLGSRVEPEQG
ncbi:MAG: Npt1/Npt2 family nucleotide transporter [Chloroflexota bacterium]